MLPYRDPSLSVDQRVADLLARMTTEEKVGQMLQINGQANAGDQVALAAKLGAGSVLCVVGADTVPHQRAALASRLGIPVLFGIDAIHGHSMWHGATMYPTQLGLACAWDADLAQRVARATAVEMAYTGVSWTFAPVFCLPRDLRWGRVNETCGEDPVLVGILGAAMVRGFQGDDLKDRTSVAACAKHYLGYGDSMGGRDASESEHTPRKIRSLFLPPFQTAVSAGVATVMTGYQAIDGTPCTANRWLLTDVLRGELGFTGMVVTDWDNVGIMVRDQRVCADVDDASARALNAGNDLIMNTPAFYEATLRNLACGRVSLAAIDQAVSRILALKVRLGLFEDPRLPDEAAAATVVGCAAHRSLAAEAATRALVLLKNRNGLLPLAPERLRRVAVVGPFADDALEQNGDWSLGAGQGQGLRERHPRSCNVTVRDGLERRLAAAGVTVVYAEGCQIHKGWARWDSRTHHPDRAGDDQGRIARAVATTQGADAVVVVLGDGILHTGEFKSTATLELPGAQLDLLRALHRTGVPLIVVLQSGKPLAVPEAAELADAFIVQFSPGMEGGTALAALLCGDCEPEGRLPISFPYHVGQQPVSYLHVPGAHGDHHPDLGHAGHRAPLFAFGQGLSYTTVTYTSLTVASAKLRAGEALSASVLVTNTGNRPATETVQVYLRDLFTSATWPERRLIAWQKVTLAPGEAKRVAFGIPHRELACCDASGAWVVEPGDFEVLVGCSSREADLKRMAFAVLPAC